MKLYKNNLNILKKDNLIILPFFSSLKLGRVLNDPLSCDSILIERNDNMLNFDDPNIFKNSKLMRIKKGDKFFIYDFDLLQIENYDYKSVKEGDVILVPYTYTIKVFKITKILKNRFKGKQLTFDNYTDELNFNTFIDGKEIKDSYIEQFRQIIKIK